MTKEKDGRIKLRRRRLLQSGAFLGSTVGVGVPALAGAGQVAAAGEGAIFSDDFEDGDLSEWDTSTTSNAGVRLDGGRMRLRVYKCNTAIAERSLGDLSGTLTVSFDWENLSEQWYESTGWHLLDGDGNEIDYEVVEGTDVRSPGYRGNRSGSVTVKAPVDGPVTLRFRVSPSSHCRNFDHANTYLWIDNVVAEAGAGGGDQLAKFNEVKEEKLALAEHITDISQSINETERVKATLNGLEERIGSGEIDPNLAVEAVERMKHGENLSEFLIAGFSPSTVPGNEHPGSLVGIRPQRGDYDVAGNLVDVGVSWALELLMGLATIVRMAKYVVGLKKVIRGAASRARKGLQVVYRTLFGKFPQIQRAVKVAADGINDDMVSVIESGVTEGGKLAAQIATKISGIRDDVANRIVEQFEDDRPAELVLPTDISSKLAELDAKVGGGTDGVPDIQGGTNADIDGISTKALDAIDSDLGPIDSTLQTAEGVVLGISFLSLVAQVLVAATGIGIVAAGTIEIATILFNLGVTTLAGIAALTIMQHALHNHNKGIDAILAADEEVSYQIL